MTKSISILIPSVPERAAQYEALIYELDRQRQEIYSTHPTLGTIEILGLITESVLNGGETVGEKRNKLVQSATSDYLCFIDDDDNVAPNYLEQLLRATRLDVDCITFNTLFKNDNYWTVIEMKLGSKNKEASPNYPVRRNIWHTCPIRSSIAKEHEFSKLNHNEDWTWIERLLPYIQTSYHIPFILNQYNHSSKTSIADKAYERYNS